MLSVSGMTCDGCAKTVIRILSRVPSVSGAEVDFAAGRALVRGSANPQDLVAAIQAAGYGAQFDASDATAGGRNERS